MKNFKIILFFAILASGLSNAQSICYPVSNTYSVDGPNANEDTVDGTYEWSLSNANGDDFSNFLSQSPTEPNKVTIDWTNSAFVIGNYTLKVIESIGNCTDESQITIALSEGYKAPEITDIQDDICIGDSTSNDAFVLTGGTPDAIIEYSITDESGNTTTGLANLDSSGVGSVPFPKDADDKIVPGTYTLTLISIDDNDTDSCAKISLLNNDGTPKITETVVLITSPVTSEITPVTPTP